MMMMMMIKISRSLATFFADDDDHQIWWVIIDDCQNYEGQVVGDADDDIKNHHNHDIQTSNHYIDIIDD